MKLLLLILFAAQCCYAQNSLYPEDNWPDIQEIDTIDLKVIEYSLNNKNFKQYWHFKSPKWSNLSFYSSYPLRQNKADILLLFSKPILVVEEDTTSNNLIRLVQANQLGAIMELVFDYKIEGIVYSVLVQKNGDQYLVLKYRIEER